jgi:hypothetical protein
VTLDTVDRQLTSFRLQRKGYMYSGMQVAAAVVQQLVLREVSTGRTLIFTTVIVGCYTP